MLAFVSNWVDMYNKVQHTLLGSWYIQATNHHIKQGCMKDSVLLRYDAVSPSNRMATFRGNVMSSWSVQTSRNVRRFWALQSFIILHNTLPLITQCRGIISQKGTPSHTRYQTFKTRVAVWSSYMLMTIRELRKQHVNVSCTAGIKRNSTGVQSMRDFMSQNLIRSSEIAVVTSSFSSWPPVWQAQAKTRHKI
jgi:hypothetical protein